MSEPLIRYTMTQTELDRMGFPYFKDVPVYLAADVDARLVELEQELARCREVYRMAREQAEQLAQMPEGAVATLRKWYAEKQRADHAEQRLAKEQRHEG